MAMTLLEASLADRVAVRRSQRSHDVAGSFAAGSPSWDARLAEFPARVDGDVSDFEDLHHRRGLSVPRPCTAAAHRGALAAGGFDETTAGAEDWDAWLRLMRSGYQFIDQLGTVAYRMKRASMVGRRSVGHLEVGKGLLDPCTDRLFLPAYPRWPCGSGRDAVGTDPVGGARPRTLSFAPLIAVGDPERAEATVQVALVVAPARKARRPCRPDHAARRAEQTRRLALMPTS